MGARIGCNPDAGKPVKCFKSLGLAAFSPARSAPGARATSRRKRRPRFPFHSRRSRRLRRSRLDNLNRVRLRNRRGRRPSHLRRKFLSSTRRLSPRRRRPEREPRVGGPHTVAVARGATRPSKSRQSGLSLTDAARTPKGEHSDARIHCRDPYRLPRRRRRCAGAGGADQLEQRPSVRIGVHCNAVIARRVRVASKNLPKHVRMKWVRAHRAHAD